MSTYYQAKNLLTSVKAGELKGRSVTVPSEYDGLDTNAFKKREDIENVTMSDSVKAINTFAFRDCKNLRSITVGNGIEVIQTGTFWGCGRLQAIIIPSGVTAIEENAFFGCTGLTSVTCLNPVPPEIRVQSVFDGVDKETACVYVPEGSVEKYKSAAYWKEFKNIKVKQ